MFCPRCHAEYRDGFVECSDCHLPLVDRLTEPGTPTDSSIDAHEEADASDLDILIRTGFGNPVAIGLAKGLLQEAGIPFFTMDQNPAARQESGNFLGWWNVRVPRERAAEAREILQSVEEMDR
jgi:hypothetical protein